MPNISITTNGTTPGTVLTIDGKDITKDEKVVNIYLDVYSPYVSKYSGETISGGSSVSYRVINSDGVAETRQVTTDNTNYKTGIGQTIDTKDSVIRFLGQPTDDKISKIVDKIVSFCDDKKLTCPNKDILLGRTEISLMDKISDLGIKLEG